MAAARNFDSMEYISDNAEQLITVSDDDDPVVEAPGRSQNTDTNSNMVGVDRSNDVSASSRPQSVRLPQLTIEDVLAFLRANNLQAAESVLRQESQNLKPTLDNGEKSADGFASDLASEVKTEPSNRDNDRLMSLADVASSSSIPELFRRLVAFVDKVDPSFYPELSTVLPAAFMHVHLHNVRQLRRYPVEKVYDTYVSLIPQSLLSAAPVVRRDVTVLRRVRKPEDMRLHPLCVSLISSKYIVNLSRSSYDAMKTLLLGPGMVELLRLLAENLYFDNEDRKPRSIEEVLQNYGGLLGEARSSLNKQKMFIGLPKELSSDYVEEEPAATATTTATPAAEPAASAPAAAAAAEPASKRSKKRKAAATTAAATKKADPLGVRKLKLDQNAPEYKRIPLTPISASDKLDRLIAQKEYKKAARISSSSLPSMCFYTVLNSDSTVSSMNISNDSSLLACGFTTGLIKVWTLHNQYPLRCTKSHRELAKIPTEQGDYEMAEEQSAGALSGDLMQSDELMDPQSSSESKQLMGHHGAVLDLAFTPSRHWLLTAGEDGEIRLWSLLLWQCLTVYRGHVLPVTSICFSPPPSLYFASGGFDRTVRIWSTEWPQAVRVCVGHHEDVTCVAYHPNCNYVASGSCDRTVRVWDVLDGSCCRMFSSHKDVVQCVQFSPCGQLLASGDQSGTVCLYKLSPSSAALCATIVVSSNQLSLANMDAAIYSLAFSRDSNTLAVGSGGCLVAVYMIERFPAQQSSENKQQQQQQQQSAALAASLSSSSACTPIRLEPLTTSRTKLTPVHLVHFTRRNLLLAAGPIDR